MRRLAIVATLPFRFRFFFQAALDGVRPPKPVFMILDVRYLDPKTPYSFKKVWSASAHLILPRKSVEGLFGYSGLWLWGDSKSSGDLYPRAECKRIRL